MPVLQGDAYIASYAASGGTLAGATVTLTVTAPDGTTSTPAASVNATAGTALATVPAAQAGSYLLVWLVTGSVTDVEQDQFTALMPALELISLTDARDEVGLDPNDHTYDAKLRRWIHAAADVIEHVCGPIRGQARTDFFDGDTTFVVHPYRWVKALTAVSETRGITVYPLTEQPLGSSVNAFGYTWDRTVNKIIRRGYGGGVVLFPPGEQIVRVDSLLGFATIPTDIQMAAADLVAHWYKRSLTPGGGTRIGYPGTESAGDEMRVGNYLVPNATMELLSPWTRRPGIF